MGNCFYYDKNSILAHHTLSSDTNTLSFKMHTHERFELYMLISGNCSWLVEGNEYLLKPNDIIIVRPSEAHTLKLLSNEPYERIAIHLPLSFFSKFDNLEVLLKPFNDRPLGCNNHYSSELFDNRLCHDCFENIGNNSSVDLGLDIECKSLTILSEIYKVYLDRLVNNFDIHNKSDVSIRLIEYINKNLFSDLSLSELSDYFFLSKSQLNRIFKKSTGSSIWEYITIKRLLFARDRIKTGESTGKVCIDCGFKDYSSFYRIYKKHFGVSPKQDSQKK